MCGAKGVIDAFAAFSETTEAILLAEGPYTITASCQDFMWIGLMRHIPNNSIFWGIKDRMQCNS